MILRCLLDGRKFIRVFAMQFPVMWKSKHFKGISAQARCLFYFPLYSCERCPIKSGMTVVTCWVWRGFVLAACAENARAHRQAPFRLRVPAEIHHDAGVKPPDGITK